MDRARCVAVWAALGECASEQQEEHHRGAGFKKRQPLFVPERLCPRNMSEAKKIQAPIEMTKRKPPISEQQRALLAANKRRCRKRQSKGQKVFKITAHAELVIDLLVHKGHLPDIPVPTTP